MSLSEEMRACVSTRAGLDDFALAECFLAKRTKRDLLPLLAEEFAHIRRGMVRLAEAHALSQTPSLRTVPTVAAVRGALGGLARLLDESYRIGDGVERRAGDMTLEEWQLRRVMLESQVIGISRAIEVCDRAIQAIERAGVGTLREIGQLESLAVAA